MKAAPDWKKKYEDLAAAARLTLKWFDLNPSPRPSAWRIAEVLRNALCPKR